MGVGHEVGDRFGQAGGQSGIDLDGRYLVAGFQEAESQGAQPRSDLQNRVIGTHLGQTDDSAHGSGVDDEILPQSLGGVDPGQVGYAADIRSSEEVSGLGLVRIGGVGDLVALCIWGGQGHQYHPVCSECRQAPLGLPYLPAI